MDILLHMITGALLLSAYQYLTKHFQNVKLTEECSRLYREVYESILSNRSSFKSRVNNCVEILVDTPSYGSFQLFYYPDKKDLVLARSKEIVYTTHYCKPEIIEKVSNLILSKYNREISDVIRLGNHVIDANTYNSIVNSYYPSNFRTPPPSSFSYDLDDVLDRISQVGYDNLTDGEKDFLKSIK